MLDYTMVHMTEGMIQDIVMAFVIDVFVVSNIVSHMMVHICQDTNLHRSLVLVLDLIS